MESHSSGFLTVIPAVLQLSTAVTGSLVTDGDDTGHWTLDTGHWTLDTGTLHGEVLAALGSPPGHSQH